MKLLAFKFAVTAGIGFWNWHILLALAGAVLLNALIHKSQAYEADHHDTRFL